MSMRLVAGHLTNLLAVLGAATVGCSQSESMPEAIPVSEGYAVTPDSVRLWYRVVGSGPDVVIVPNALFHRERLDTLASATRRIVLYDPRGRGRSDSIPPASASLEHNVADVEVIRQAVNADSVSLIGWSGMGMELFVYALRHPTRVRRLVQLAPVAPRWVPYSDSLGRSRAARTDSAAWAQLQARERAGEFANDQAGLCRARNLVTNPASFGDTSVARLAPDVCDSPNEWPNRIGAYFGALLGSMGQFDWRRDLPRVTIPRLVIHGERDNTPLAGNCEWVTGQPNARMFIVREAGHWPHYERPAATIPAIRAFLDGAWPEGTGGCT
ncbi:MAG TPA: alpha/beta hydrolase [Gemmatimonadaceae bacterium]|nr:alpha/beta hydrolase [Gemmatimonadaceae bacterium]